MTNKDFPSWDATLWLKEFEASKRVVGGTRPVRAKVFQSTLEIVNCGGYQTPSGTNIELGHPTNPHRALPNYANFDATTIRKTTAKCE